MKKRIRKKVEKRRAAERDASLTLSPLQQLQAALHDLKHSAAYLFDTALGEVQHSAASLAQQLRARVEKLLGTLGQPLAATRSDHARVHDGSLLS